MSIQPYLFFDGRCEEAIEFYRGALGAELQMLMRFDESPDPLPAGALAPNWGKKVMHASFSIGGAVVMASDGMSPETPKFAGFSLSYTVPDAMTAERVFKALSAGGKVTMPLGKTFWSPCFGMLTDRFGVGWMVGVFHT